MIRVLLALAFVALLANRLPAQKPTSIRGAKRPAVPKKVIDQLKPILNALKKTPAEVIEKKPGQFVKVQEVASGVRTFPAVSDFADKPYTVRVNWTSNHQETKIYADRERAERSNDWLAVGKVAGANGAWVVPQT
jgi:hypothetical protein